MYRKSTPMKERKKHGREGAGQDDTGPGQNRGLRGRSTASGGQRRGIKQKGLPGGMRGRGYLYTSVIEMEKRAIMPAKMGLDHGKWGTKLLKSIVEKT